MEDKLGPAMNITAGLSFFGGHWLEVGNESVTRILIELIQHSVIQTDIMLIGFNLHSLQPETTLGHLLRLQNTRRLTL